MKKDSIGFARFKFTNVLSKNRGYSKLVIIDSIISDEKSECDEDDELSVKDLSCFKYAQIISCDFEISFYKYKSMLRMNRRVFNSKT